MQKIGWTTPSLSIFVLNGRHARAMDIFKNLRLFDWNIMAGLRPIGSFVPYFVQSTYSPY